MKKSISFLSLILLTFASCGSDDVLTEISPNLVNPIESGVIAANVGGPNQPNQVYIDLSSNIQNIVKRDTWDLGFSTDSQFRVIINGSVKMAVKKLNTTNIDEVQTEDEIVAVGYSTYAKFGFVDDPTGKLNGIGNGEGTAIAEVSSNISENYVYLVNMGFEVGVTKPNPGSVSLDGNSRGWKKIKVSRQGDDYILDYANLTDTTHKTLKVSKKADYNFVFINLSSGQEVKVQPEKHKWDLFFTGFTNYFPAGQEQITYYFADFITTNMLNGTKVYMVQSSAEKLEDEYKAFSKANVNESLFNPSITDQRLIGDTWRNGGGPSTQPSIKDDRFYILKDADANLFKIKFIALTNDSGERGYPVFDYAILN